jgi:hypothetical protein
MPVLVAMMILCLLEWNPSLLLLVGWPHERTAMHHDELATTMATRLMDDSWMRRTTNIYIERNTPMIHSFLSESKVHLPLLDLLVAHAILLVE